MLRPQWERVLRVLSQGDWVSEADGMTQAQLGVNEWAQGVAVLQRMGLPVERTPLGCRVVNGAYLPNPESIGELTGATVRLAAETGSTNDWVRDFDATVSVAIALHQTAGRGRRGRHWVGVPGCTLMMSVQRRMRSPIEALAGASVVIGVSLCRFLRTLSVPAMVKWPNDLWVGGRKLGGVLVEVDLAADGELRVIVGLGLNIVAVPVPVVEVTSMDAHLARPWTDEDTVGIIQAIEEALSTGVMRPAEERVAAFRLFDALSGRGVSVIGERATLEGIAIGIDGSGQLLIQTEGGVVALNQGEVSVRTDP